MDVVLYIAFMASGVAIAVAFMSRMMARERRNSDERLEHVQQSEREQSEAMARGYERQIDLHIESAERLRVERDSLSEKSIASQREHQQDRERLFASITALERDLAEKSTKVDAIESAEKKIKENFEHIARAVLEEKSSQISALNREGLGNILAPLAKDIDLFKRQVEHLHLDQAKQSSALSTELKQLIDLNRQLSDDALNLTRALKGEHNPKMQGDWGEMILDSVLSGSGLKQGEHYFLQESERGEDGRQRRPDVIVRYPDKREIIIDSKVSLTAYSRFMEAENQEDRDQALSEHLLSVRRHIDSLSSKEYQKRSTACDFVMMFMPIEPAYIAALGADNRLWEYAYKRKIVLVSPTHLITALKLVYDLWSRYDQSQNALKIASRGAELYDKFAGFITDMNQIGKAIDNTKKQYDSAVNKLHSGKGNLVRQAQMLKELGVRATKEIAMQSKDEFEIPDEES